MGSERVISLAGVDIAIIAIYFIIVLAIGIYLKRFATSGEDFFMAGREMTAWVAGLSFLSANLGSAACLPLNARTRLWNARLPKWNCASPCAIATLEQG